MMVRGTDSPTFALYEDGRVIFCTSYAPHTVGTAWEKESAYATFVLDEAARKKLLGSALGDDPGAFAKLDATYTLSTSTDQTTSTVHVWVGGERHSVSVYGQMRDRSGDARKAAPVAFLAAFDAAAGYAEPAAVAWNPTQLEVMFTDFSYAKWEPVKWPEDWPGLDDPTTRKFRDDYYWIHLDAKHHDRLLALLRGLERHFGEASQAVELGKRNWGVDFRRPFPAEELWMNK